MPRVMSVVCRCAVVLEVYWCRDLLLVYCIDTPLSLRLALGHCHHGYNCLSPVGAS